MRKKSMFPMLIIAISCLGIFGCKKAYDYLNHHPNDDLKLCNITKLKFTPHSGCFVGGAQDSALFKYNTQGDPISIKRSCPGDINFNFRYDKKHRLTDFAGVYGDGLTIYEWHRYIYDNKDRVIIDSTYNTGIFGDVPTGDNGEINPGIITVERFKYDSKNRIIEGNAEQNSGYEISGYPDPGNNHFISTYTYNAQDNLSRLVANLVDTAGHILDGETYNFTSYDSKININRTNSIWKFLNRDYSLNNSITAVAYNAFGLPLQYPAKSAFNFIKYGGFYNVNTVEYECK